MNIHNITSIAHYESKLLRRSWLFKIFAILAIIIITLATLITQTKAFTDYAYTWDKIALSSFMPIMTSLFYGITQAIIVVFLLGNSLSRAKKIDTAEVLLVRPMSNADFILGKVWGIVKVFVGLNVVILGITAFLNVAVNNSSFDITLYLFYLFTLSIIPLLFVISFSFVLTSILKSQAISMIVALGLVVIGLFELYKYQYGVFDFSGLRIPNVFSDAMGHANLRIFLIQRLTYLLVAMGMISLTIGFTNRLPQKKWKKMLMFILGGVFMLAGVTSGYIYYSYNDNFENARLEYAKIFDKYANENNVNILYNDIVITPNSYILEAESAITITNNNLDTIKEINLFLNPSLQVTSIKYNGENLDYMRDKQVIVIDHKIDSKDTIQLKISYQGTIDDAVCYTDIDEETYYKEEYFFVFGRKFSWISDEFIMLTPETMWYPTAIAMAHPSSPYRIKKDFTTFSLRVKYDDSKIVLSQGEHTYRNGEHSFVNNMPMLGISLNIADYKSVEMNIDSVNYRFLYFDDNSYIADNIAELRDTLPGLIRNFKTSLEIEKGRDYLYDRFTIAEVPIQFKSYVRTWRNNNESIQPEIVFFQEKGSKTSYDFEADKARFSRNYSSRGDRAVPEEDEITIMVFNHMLNTLFNATIKYVYVVIGSTNYIDNTMNITPMFSGAANYINSEDYPIMDLVFANFINTMNNSATLWRRNRGSFNEIDNTLRASIYFSEYSFSSVFSRTDIKPTLFAAIVNLKTLELKNYITSRISLDDFNKTIIEIADNNKFQEVTLDLIISTFKDRYDLDIAPFLVYWYHSDVIPELHFKNVEANEVIIDEQTMYQTKLNVYNPTKVDAIITVAVAEGGGNNRGNNRGGQRGGGGMMMAMTSPNSSSDVNYIIPSESAQEIKIITDTRPSRVNINTNIAKNIPNSQQFSFPKIETTTRDTASGIHEISKTVFALNPDEIVIDNLDKGFRIVDNIKQSPLKKLFEGKDPNSEDKYKPFYVWWSPNTWTEFIHTTSNYGELIRSAFYKKKGNGTSKLIWATVVPEEGMYDIYIWNSKAENGNRRQGRANREQTYTIKYGTEIEDITLDMSSSQEGWIHIGNFYCTKDTTSVVLSDDTPADYVIGDAVKFIRNKK